MGKARISKRVIATQVATKPASSGPAVPAHVQRKVNKKVSFLQKLSSARAATQLKPTGAGIKKRRRTSKALSDYSALADSLGAGAALTPAAGKGTRARGKGVRTLKARNAIGKTEGARLQAVLGHAAFQADPLAAVKSHLEATLPPPAPAPAPVLDPAQRRKEKKARRKQRDAMAQD